METGREYADNFVGLPIQQDLAPHDVAVGSKSAPPQLVIEQHDIVSPGLIFFFQKGASQLGARSQHGKQAGGNASAGQPLRFARSGEIATDAADHCHLLKPTDVLAPGKKVHRVYRNQRRKKPELGNHFVNHKQAAFVAVTQRPEKDCVHNGEDGGIGANGKGESGHGHNAESGVASHGAPGNAEIGPNAHGEPPGGF